MNDGKIKGFVVSFLYLLCIGLFFTETVFPWRQWKKGISVALLAVVSAFLAYAGYLYKKENEMANLPYDIWQRRITAAYAIILFICGIYFCN